MQRDLFAPMCAIISKIRNNIKPLNRLHNVTIYTARSHPVATIWTNYRSDRIKFQPIEISRMTRCAASGYASLLRSKKKKKKYPRRRNIRYLAIVTHAQFS